MAHHTATGEWQSFEIRMRRRRAERLALRAEAAARAGCIEDARALLDEARTLEPGLPELAQVERLLIADPPREKRRWRAVPGLAASLVVSAALTLAWRNYPAQPVPSPQSAAQAVTTALPPAASPATNTLASPPLPPASTQLVAATTGTIAEPAAAAVPIVPALDTSIPEPVGAPIEPPSPAVSAPPEPMPVPTGPRIESTLPALPSAEMAPPPEPPQEPLVRSVLSRYASAYNALDADAAQRVWPGVNRPALSRAFDALSSQQVSLGDCRINITGARAEARCAGTATWTPKVGSETRSEARNWMFELSREGSEWQIVSARVQNR